MSLIPWKSKRSADTWDDDWPRSQMTRFRSEMDQLFENFFGRAWGAVEAGYGALSAWAPTLDVTETESGVTVRAEVPGIDPSDLEITVVGRTLTLAGEKKETTETKEENYFHSERRFGSFRRSVELPVPVNTEKVTAEHKNGVVLIQIPKDPTSIPRRIPVKAADK